jgi:hypothetical protein
MKINGLAASINVAFMAHAGIFEEGIAGIESKEVLEEAGKREEVMEPAGSRNESLISEPVPTTPDMV